MIRIPQQNDWVVLLIVSCIFLYIFMLHSLRRDSSVWEFLSQKLADSSNNLLSWLIIGVVFCLTLSTVLSQYLPIVPDKIRDLQLFGYELNKFGFTFVTVSVFFILRTFLSYLFFAGAGALSKWEIFYFSTSKFYFCFSLVLIVLSIVQFFFSRRSHRIIRGDSWRAFIHLFLQVGLLHTAPQPHSAGSVVL